MISKKEIINYHKFGYVKIENFYSLREIKLFNLAINKIKKSNSKDIYKYFEPNIINPKKQNLFRIEGFYSQKGFLKSAIESKKIQNCIKLLTGKKYTIFKEKINFKPPGSRSDHLHQDVQGGWLKYSKNFISVVISIDKSEKDNSNLIFDVSGNNSKKLVIKEMKKILSKDLSKPRFKAMPLNKGDVIFFNGFVPHKSSKNLSKKKRTQVYLTYSLSNKRNIRSDYFKDKLLSYPPNNLRDPKKKYTFKI